jgi:RNA-directed DNA polymerase
MQRQGAAAPCPSEKRRVFCTNAGSRTDERLFTCGLWRFPRDKSVNKLRDGIRAKTRRTHGHSLARIIESVNATLRGCFAYFKHCHRNSFPEIDKWVRMRLRSILRKRHQRKGRGGGYDHIRWPNAYFTKHGLFNLGTAHAKTVQSP